MRLQSNGDFDIVNSTVMDPGLDAYLRIIIVF